MSTEIKIDQLPIEGLLNQLNEASALLNSLFANEVEGTDHLSSIAGINEINQSYHQLITSYQVILRQHITISKHAIQTMVDTDQSLANYKFIQK